MLKSSKDHLIQNQQTWKLEDKKLSLLDKQWIDLKIIFVFWFYWIDKVSVNAEKIWVIWYNKCLSLISFKRERSHACHDLFPIGCPCVRDDWTRVNGLKYELIINFRTECDEGVVYLQLFVKSVQASHGMDLPRFPQSPPVLISFLNLQGLYFLTWWGTLGVFQLFYWSFHCWNVTGPVICCQYLTDSASPLTISASWPRAPCCTDPPQILGSSILIAFNPGDKRLHWSGSGPSRFMNTLLSIKSDCPFEKQPLKLIRFLSLAEAGLSALIVCHAMEIAVRKRQGVQWKLNTMSWKDQNKTAQIKSEPSILSQYTFYSQLPGKLRCLYKECNPRS